MDNQHLLQYGLAGFVVLYLLVHFMRVVFVRVVGPNVSVTTVVVYFPETVPPRS